MKTILMDLDGTLLPMKQEEFINCYFGLIGKRFEPMGLDPKRLMECIWIGTKAMIENNGEKTNELVFWECFEKVMGINRDDWEEAFNQFYNDQFNQVIRATQPTPLASEVVRICKEKGYQIVLATNPIFPAIGTKNRVKWAGLDEDDFHLITTYENSHSCKPNPAYFQEIIEKLKLDPSECLMVGNDAVEDTIAKTLGIPVYLVTDCLENEDIKKIEPDYKGSMEEFADFVKELPSIN